MTNFYVQDAVEKKRFKGNYGPRVVYALTIKDEDHVLMEGVELVQKPETPAPQPGEAIDGELTTNDFGVTLKKTYAGPVTGGRGGGRSPEETKSIIRQHSADMALRYLGVKAQLGVLKDFKIDDVKPLIDWFVKDAAGDVR